MKSYISRKFPLATLTIERKPVVFCPDVMGGQDSSPRAACTVSAARPPSMRYMGGGGGKVAAYGIVMLPVFATPELFV